MQRLSMLAQYMAAFLRTANRRVVEWIRSRTLRELVYTKALILIIIPKTSGQTVCDLSSSSSSATVMRIGHQIGASDDA